MFLKIPSPVIDFTMLKLAEHVYNAAPLPSRNVARLVSKAVDAIADAEGKGDDVAEMPDDVAKAFQVAADAAPTPELGAGTKDNDGKVKGPLQPIPRRAFERLYAAIEGMTAERPEPTVAPEPVPAPESTETLVAATEPQLAPIEAVAAE